MLFLQIDQVGKEVYKLHEYGPIGIFLIVTLFVIYVMDKRNTSLNAARVIEFQAELKKVEDKLDKEIQEFKEYREGRGQKIIDSVTESKEFIRECRDVIAQHTQTTKELIQLVKNLTK